MKKVYYAHCLAIYNTPTESRDLLTLSALGFEVVNPNQPAHQQGCTEMAKQPGKNAMDYFEKFADECDLIAFRSLPDGGIPAGVAKEVEWFKQRGKPVIELPCAIARRSMPLDVTREYLSQCGQR